MRNVISHAEQRVVLDNISWSTYIGLVTDSDDRHSRMAYDQGTLEIMSPSQRHEHVAAMIGRLVEVFTEEMDIAVRGVRSTTFKREDQQRGFEADASYYIGNFGAIMGRDEIDLAVDPPPDLCIEVDISRSSIATLAIYGGLRVSEIWRYVGDSLQIYVLRDDGSYDRVRESSVLLRFPLDDLPRFLALCRSQDDTQVVRSFRVWMRERR